MRIAAFFLILTVVLNWKPCLAQTDADSLKNLLLTEKRPEKRFLLYKKLFIGAYYGNDHNAAYNYAEKCLETAEAMHNDTLAANAFFWKGTSLHSLGKPELALPFYKKSIEKGKNMRLQQYMSSVQNHYAISLQELGRYPEAIEHDLEAAKIAERLGEKSLVAGVYNHLALTHGMSGNVKAVEKYYLMGLKIFRELNDAEGQCISLNGLAQVYIQHNRLAEAKKYADEGMEITLKASGESVHTLMGTQAEILMKQGKPKQAIPLLLRSIRILNSKHIVFNSTEQFTMLGQAYLQAGELEKGISIFDSAVKMAVIRKWPREEMQNRQYIAEAYRLKREYYPAFENLKIFEHIKDSLWSSDRTKQEYDMLTKYKTEQKEHENIVLRKNLEVEQRDRYILIGGLAASGICLALLGFVFSQNVKASRQARHLAEEKNRSRLLEMGKKALEMEKELLIRKNHEQELAAEQQRMRAELEHKSNELAGIAGYMVRRNEIIASVKRGVSKLSYLDKDMQKLVEDMDEYIDVKEEWEDFRRHFETVNPGFITRLSAACPDLTDKELKMCAYIRMNLDIKQISNLLNVQDASVHNFRSRLRKKFGLEQGQDLNLFIIGL